MAGIIWTDPAITDLEAIGDHIALDDYEAARRLTGKVFERIELLEDHPSLARVPRDLRNTPYRKLIVNPVYAYDRIDGDKVIIIHVTQAKRDFDPSRFSRRR